MEEKPSEVNLPPGEELVSIATSQLATDRHLLLLTRSRETGTCSVWRAYPGKPDPQREWIIREQSAKAPESPTDDAVLDNFLVGGTEEDNL